MNLEALHSTNFIEPLHLNTDIKTTSEKFRFYGTLIKTWIVAEVLEDISNAVSYHIT